MRVLLQKFGGACLPLESSCLCCYPEHLRDHTILRKDIALRDTLELAFPEHMHRLIALDGPLGGMERSKPSPG